MSLESHLCIYCMESYSDAELSKEHIIPKALGGTLVGPPFVTSNVCKKCNNDLGQFVDAPFIRSFFIKNDIALGHLSLDQKGTMVGTEPVYMSKLEGLTPPTSTVELYLLHSGKSSVLHIHNNFDSRSESLVGGNPITAKKNPGVAIFLNAAESEEDAKKDLHQFINKFKRQDRVVYGIDFHDQIVWEAVGRKPSRDEEVIIDNYIKSLENPIKGSFSVDIFFSNRFIAKLSYGFGYVAGGASYINSSYASTLREYMWTQDSEKREQLPVLLSSYWDRPSLPIGDFLNFPNIISASYIMIAGGLYLYFSLFDKPFLSLISNDISIFQKSGPLRKVGFGASILINPKLKKAVTLVSIEDLIAHQQGHIVNELDELLRS
ncbi:HNH endonuclease [Alloalcanivorax xenomutans]|uniref:HNH endonuclease n=1 Tax=Alloalcanivorax xenomutans TaxID=1094342 RepID=UPI003A8110E2